MTELYIDGPAVPNVPSRVSDGGVRMGLVEFLLARLAEREALAREADRVYVHPAKHDPGFGARDDDDVVAAYWDDVADPQRVLAEVEAKQILVARCRAARHDAATAELAEDTLRLLARPYANHLDFQPEWWL